MSKFYIFFLLFFSFAFADTLRDIKIGENIVNMMCDKSKLSILKSSTTQDILKSGACKNLKMSDATKVSLFLSAKNHPTSSPYITVAKGAKCPVCGMFIEKYPKWVAKVTLNGKDLYFDGVKDMMKYLIYKGDFKFDRTKISSILVTDYYTLESINAKNAFYVVGSNVYGPMGHELIAFKDKASANNFMKSHSGKKIVTYAQITQPLVQSLDD
ncbi:MAG: nitrous oxide reductase accessory protein NosL [Epsilonproteobacteria bacterium]|nr:nitrous oxide reductase accessory protein NosL [Campylobacterota bacterium]MBD3838975.1 nitrous oxide reductase accessory protein NosL [Campylobacterota bacterium]